jgi:hypothetical protein
MPFQNPTPPLSPNDYYLGPNGGTLGYCAAETMPRWALSGNFGLGNGTLELIACYIPANTLITKLGFVCGGTSANGPTHTWLGLYDSNRNQLAMTADQLSAAVTTNTAYAFNIATTAAGAASSFTTTYSGLYYIGVMSAASTSPFNIYGESNTSIAVNAIAPIAIGTSDTTQTTVPAFPHQAIALTVVSGCGFLYAA